MIRNLKALVAGVIFISILFSFRLLWVHREDVLSLDLHRPPPHPHEHARPPPHDSPPPFHDFPPPPPTPPSIPEDSLPYLPKEALPQVGSNTDDETENSKVCAGFAQDLDLVLVVKTGATEASKRLPHQLVSFVSCAEARGRLVVFSDMEETIGNIHVHDSLAHISAKATYNNTEFDLYREQKAGMAEGKNMGSYGGRGQESWALDKYKNIYTAQGAWDLKPGRDWYFFIDVDTYLVWSSLSAYLARFDPSKPWYLGADVGSEWGPFAHGGSGYAISRAAMETITGPKAAQIASAYDEHVRMICCGDMEIARMLRLVGGGGGEAGKQWGGGTRITDAHPMMNGDNTNDYRMDKKRWCKPLITMHHIGPEAGNAFWQFERRRPNPEKPLLQAEIWSSYLEPHLPPVREGWNALSPAEQALSMPLMRDDWNNLSGEGWKYWHFTEEQLREKETIGTTKHFLKDLVKGADPHMDSWKSFESCVRACKEKDKHGEECIQVTYLEASWADGKKEGGDAPGSECWMQKNFRFGGDRGVEKREVEVEVEPEVTKDKKAGEVRMARRGNLQTREKRKREVAIKWRSAWDMERIQVSKERMGPCDEVDFTTFRQY